MEYSSSSSENLDDGELWLPSDIFPVEEPLDYKLKNSNPITCSFCSCLHSFHHDHQEAASAISILQHHQAHNTHTVPKPFSITERRFRQAERCCSCMDCSVLESFERNGGVREMLRTGPPPVYPYHLYPPPVQLQHQQDESLMEARTSFIQMQEKKSRFIRMRNLRRNLGVDRFVENRFLPFVEGGGFNGESNSVSDYDGTGVFLPRVLPTNINNNGGKRQDKSISNF
ncbi:unnamed protein product [Withania somnifera]